eukprot:Gregarina_sp_Pseudo_9__1@NODE_1000_length_1984_cov_22_348586_g937_i0_p2_GENE_NODE_1000_length_1984_cov_22_348586_g937_i0NODE_1000_length_1984_cov_22_348586_g937_i0_p2_ORF_typecomplete_len168_score5_41Prefoldin_2/PF01920_20/8_9e05SPAM/PF02090_15/10SPAM/PF02090_15/0_044DUF4600/PF15372_6/0_0047DUF1732/PF08340_11/42DUF1732/PF08340_11/0_38DUF4407/PF14362_6/0_15APG6_N/PF17675_1/83APG6_N/PF17675_1/0_73zfC4H2/PF10146_9/7_2zfC4H2/PF10146_9/7_6DUF4164/PF13747_6/7_6DUF4164/PF13747_6/12SCP1/PF05483_12/0_99S
MELRPSSRMMLPKIRFKKLVFLPVRKMTARSSNYFQSELKVFTQAEIILAIRREIIRLQADREKLREAMRGIEANPKQHRVMEACNISSASSNAMFFIESTRDETLAYIHAERRRIDQELKALEKQRKEHLCNLLELKPETSTMAKADLDFLLQDVGREDDEDGSAY